MKKFLTEQLLTQKPYGVSEIDKKKIFIDALKEELIFHYNNNKEYERFCKKKGFDPYQFEGDLSLVPPISVSVFKEVGSSLISVKESDIKISLTSSATSGIPSTVNLDKITSKRQSKAMIKVIKEFIGSSRIPFLIMDLQPTVSNINLLGARYAAILGYINFASETHYCLKNIDKKVDFDIDFFLSTIKDLNKRNECLVIFGFTYILYSKIIKQLLIENKKFTLPKNTKVIHIGGWKKLEDEKVSKQKFNSDVEKALGIRTQNIIDIYGFTEQMGLNYPDCKCGYKHVPVYSEVIARNPITGEMLRDGEHGALQFFSPIPHSYPGNVVLTDDIGFVDKQPCPYGKEGTRFKVLGRLKKAEIRGCGDILSNKLKFVDSKSKNINNSSTPIEIHLFNGPKISDKFDDEKKLSFILSSLNEKKQWLSKQPIDALIGLIGKVADKWLNDDDMSIYKEKGISFLGNWCKSEHLNRIATNGFRGNRNHIDSFLPFNDSRKQFLKANQRGLVCHWLAGNVQVLGMFALVQSILSKNVNLLKISSSDDGVFAKLLSKFVDVEFVTKGGFKVKGNDILETISIIYFSHQNNNLAEIISKHADVRIAWGGREAVESVSSYPSKYDCEDIILGPKVSFSVISKDLLASERKAKKIARKVAIDISVFDQTGCASPHNLFIETKGKISVNKFCELLSAALEKTSIQIPKTPETAEEMSNIHSIRGVYDFIGEVWASEDSTWSILKSDNIKLNNPVYSRCVFVNSVDHISDALKYINKDIQTIGLAANGSDAINFAEEAVNKGVMRCPEIGRMLNFESPWDGIFIMDRLVRWSTLGGPLI